MLALGLGCGAGPASPPRPAEAPAPAVRTAAPPPPTWLKGQLHAHTDRSGDSRTPPATALRWYAERGFHFVVLTDHNFVTVERGAGVLAIPGVELTQNVEACEPAPEPGLRCLLHVNALFVDPGRAGPYEFPPLEDLARRAIYGRAIAATRELGGLAQLNHPNFHYAADARLIAELVEDGVTLLEVANESGDVGNAGDPGHASTEALWDAALARGRRVFAVATDDAHHYDDAEALKRRGEEAYVGDLGWVMVRAENEVGEIRAAIERGDFYASNGVVLNDVRAGDGELTVTMGAPHRVRFVGAGGLALAEVRGSTATYRLAEGDGSYVRAVATDGAGRTAWTQPVFREDAAVHVAEPLRGPFNNLAAYCEALARDTGPRAGDDEDAAYRRQACKPGVTIKLEGGGGVIRGARVLRVRARPFGPWLERCRLAIETERGWFVDERDDATCVGITGPLQTVERSNEALAWVGGLVAYTADVERTTGSHEPGSDGRALRRDEVTRGRVLRLCGVGATGAPGCTAELVIGCADAAGRAVAATWRVDGSRLRIAADREVCEYAAPGESGPLVWP